ncbi:S1C family serine protease [Hyalangium rubrum]|uniref:Trypsin-like peptidase domain-containing protein n=1 Tax=Hyalangium rubrum TaxID=3103134 RepID=A0ABU5H5L3_9BACT|nr:trypsin-like peptidase domain-containing protein [Hyalangium sp. s54d21]MDY7228541.1 trypsin-like peptidase domain-containing protein [Hyalangium sp. s54d21]
MQGSNDARCLRCGAPDPGDRTRCLCGASLLVDVLLKEPVAEERRRFALARALSALGPPAPSFSHARTALAIPGDRIARGVSRAFAQRLIEVIAEHGASAILRSAQTLELSSQRTSRVPLVAGGLALVLIVAAAGVVWQRRAFAPQAPAPRGSTASASGDPAGTAAAAPEAAAPAALSTQEISQLASPSTVNLRCEGKTGSGFFVEADLAVTNEHVVCPPGKSMEVTLPDGRRLIGETVERDEDLDLATVRVVGANATPLKLGDATRLQPGDPLVFIGSPKGLAFTVHEGKVGFVGRQYLGVGYVQFNASVNPGNSGGPLLDARGEVVGVVSMKIENADGLGLALPIQYADKFLSLPTTPEATARWEALRQRVAQEEERELERFRLESSRPALISVERDGAVGLVALLVERFETPPRRITRRLALEVGGETCSLDVDFSFWRPMRDTMTEARDSRRLRWFVSRGLTENIHIGAARLPLESCSLSAPGPAWVRVEQGAEEMDRLPVAAEDLAAAQQAWKQKKGYIQAWDKYLQKRGVEEERARQDSEEWRANFRRARERVTRLEEDKRRWQQELDEGKDSRRQLVETELALKQAQEQLAELERYASQKGVPRQWRQ